jgi:hypothetical protein
MAKRMTTAAGTPVAAPGPRGALSPVAALGVLVVVAAVSAATAEAGVWWAPFLAGVAAGVASLRWRRLVLAVVAGAVAGWGVTLWILALRGLPAGATARAIAAFAGLPPHAAVTILATLLLAALQALAGAWLARALAVLAPGQRSGARLVEEDLASSRTRVHAGRRARA